MSDSDSLLLLTFRIAVPKNYSFGFATSNRSSIPQSSTVTTLDARSSDSAAAALSSDLARRVMVVAATPA